MNKNFEIKNIFEGNLSILYTPSYAPHDTFIGVDKRKFFFQKKEEDIFEEVFTNQKFTTKTNNDIDKFKPTIMNLEPLDNNSLTKIQLENGELTLYEVSKLYKRKNKKSKQKQIRRGKIIH